MLLSLMLVKTPGFPFFVWIFSKFLISCLSSPLCLRLLSSPPSPPETVQSCFVILYSGYALLLEKYSPLGRTPDRASLFPFGQLGTISIPKYVLHLFGTISSSYSTVILDCYFLLLFGNQSLRIIVGLCVFTDTFDQVCSGAIWCWLQVLLLKEILMCFCWLYCAQGSAGVIITLIYR